MMKEKLPLSQEGAFLRGNELSWRWGVLAGVGCRRDQRLLEAGPAREQLGFVQAAKRCVPGAVLDAGMHPRACVLAGSQADSKRVPVQPARRC